MTDLLDLRGLLDLIVACNDDDAVWKTYGWVWAQEGDAASVGFHPQTRRGDDATNDGDGEPEPPITTSPRLWLYLEAITVASILDVQKLSRPLSGLDDYAQALDTTASTTRSSTTVSQHRVTARKRIGRGCRPGCMPPST